MKGFRARRTARNSWGASALLAVGLLLAGCSGEPSSDEIAKAVEKSYATESAALQKISGSMANRLLPQLHSARKLACTKVTDASFKCDVELEVTAPGAAQRSKAPANFTFTKGSDVWSTNLR